jgi:hypothetical protein
MATKVIKTTPIPSNSDAVLIAAANEAGEAYIVHKDVWPARFIQVCKLALDGVADMTDRNAGKKGPDGKAMPKDDSVSRFLSQMSRHVTERAVPGAELSEDSAATKASELRVACKLGLMEATDKVNGLFVLADVLTARAKSANPKSVFQSYADVARETIEKKARLSTDALLPIVTKKAASEAKLSAVWEKAYKLINATLTDTTSDTYDEYEGRKVREMLAAAIDAQFKAVKGIEDDKAAVEAKTKAEEKAAEDAKAAEKVAMEFATFIAAQSKVSGAAETKRRK